MEGLRRLRRERGLTQNELSTRMGVDSNTIWRWENGLRSPDLGTLRRLGKVLDCTIDQLVGDEDSGNPIHPTTDKR